MLPFPLRSVQVDGGSEFMGTCEVACQNLGIPLHVPPPRSPKLNGCVERANRSARVEFRNHHEDPFTVAADPALSRHEFLHNHLRPH